MFWKLLAFLIYKQQKLVSFCADFNEKCAINHLQIFFQTKIHSGVILCEIYSRFLRGQTYYSGLEHVPYVYFGFFFYIFYILTYLHGFWLTYMNGCLANAMLRPLRGMRRFNCVHQLTQPPIQCFFHNLHKIEFQS